jgi:hypothetical protein
MKTGKIICFHIKYKGIYRVQTTCLEVRQNPVVKTRTSSLLAVAALLGLLYSLAEGGRVCKTETALSGSKAH